MNFTVGVVEDALWSGLEITLGVINACLPVMQPAAQRLFNIPFVRLLSFSKIRSNKTSKMSAESSAPSADYPRFSSWVRVGDSRGEGNLGIKRDMEYSVGIESDSNIPMDSMGSTTKLATPNHQTFHKSSTK